MKTRSLLKSGWVPFAAADASASDTNSATATVPLADGERVVLAILSRGYFEAITSA
jgi:hypothetical protein